MGSQRGIDPNERPPENVGRETPRASSRERSAHGSARSSKIFFCFFFFFVLRAALLQQRLRGRGANGLRFIVSCLLTTHSLIPSKATASRSITCGKHARQRATTTTKTAAWRAAHAAETLGLTPAAHSKMSALIPRLVDNADDQIFSEIRQLITFC